MLTGASACEHAGNGQGSLALEAIILILLTLLAAWLRLPGLGDRSLWLDELCTWHVSCLPFADSVQWTPEVTTPPLYQLCVRLFTTGRVFPSEWLLRVPAALSGVALIPLTYALARAFGCRVRTSTAAGFLLAIQRAHIDYSGEARAYTLLLLLSAMGVWMWYRFNQRPTTLRGLAAAGVLVAACYAHYLAVLLVPALVLWLLIVRPPWRSDQWKHVWPVLCVLVCLLPAGLHLRSFPPRVLQPFDWIAPLSLHQFIEVSSRVTFTIWYGLLLLPTAIVVSLVFWLRDHRSAVSLPGDASDRAVVAREEVPNGHASNRSLLLVLLWLVIPLGMLVLMSGLGRPSVILRYALPAVIPAILLPLMVAERVHLRGPMVVALFAALISLPRWLIPTAPEPGVRELVTWLEQRVEPAEDLVVLTIAAAPNEQWKEMKRLGLAYYHYEHSPVAEWDLSVEDPAANAVLRDPRRLYLILFRGQPDRWIERGGRRREPIEYQGISYDRLAFPPATYLMAVAPMEPAD